MSKEQFWLTLLTAWLGGWTATAVFYAVMHGVFGRTGERGADGEPGMQGPAGLRGLPGKDGECKCKCAAVRRRTLANARKYVKADS